MSSGLALRCSLRSRKLSPGATGDFSRTNSQNGLQPSICPTTLWPQMRNTTGVEFIMISNKIAERDYIAPSTNWTASTALLNCDMTNMSHHVLPQFRHQGKNIFVKKRSHHKHTMDKNLYILICGNVTKLLFSHLSILYNKCFFWIQSTSIITLIKYIFIIIIKCFYYYYYTKS